MWISRQVERADPRVVPDEEEECVIEEPDSLAVCPPQVIYMFIT